MYICLYRCIHIYIYIYVCVCGLLVGNLLNQFYEVFWEKCWKILPLLISFGRAERKRPGRGGYNLNKSQEQNHLAWINLFLGNTMHCANFGHRKAQESCNYTFTTQETAPGLSTSASLITH